MASKAEGGSRFLLAAVITMVAAALLLPPAANAQTYRGTILGTVTDQTGATVPGAKVTVKNNGTGLTRETVTTDDGSYSIPELPIGTYTVTIEKSGFSGAVTKDVRVEVAGERRVDAALKPWRRWKPPATCWAAPFRRGKFSTCPSTAATTPSC
jgi:hypothetical protein